MDSYLYEVNTITDSLVAITYPLINKELVEHTLFRLDDAYNTFPMLLFSLRVILHSKTCVLN